MLTKQGKLVWMMVTVLALALIASPAPGEEKQAAKNRVAVVNGTVITQEDFDRDMIQVEERLLSSGSPVGDSQHAELKKRVLENLINSELLYQESQKNGIKVDEAEVNKRFEKMKQQFRDEGDFKDTLSKINLSQSAAKSHLRKVMVIQQFVDERIGQKGTVSDEEIRDYYDSNRGSFKQPEQVRASHILIKVAPDAAKGQRAEAREKIEEIKQELEKGKDFAALAGEFSQCPSSKKGGDLGYFTRGRMVPAFEKEAFTLKPGEISDIVETGFGYHLIKIVGKKPENTLSFEDAKERVRQYLKQVKIREGVSAYVDKLKEKAKIEIFLSEGPK